MVSARPPPTEEQSRFIRTTKVVPDENSITLDTSQHASYPALQMDDAMRNHPSRKDSVILTACTLSLTNCSIGAIDTTSVFNTCKCSAIGDICEFFVLPT